MSIRDDYGLLSSFVHEKKLRVKNNKKVHSHVFSILKSVLIIIPSTCNVRGIL